MGRKKLDSPEDFLNNEPFKSIINILMIAPGFNDIYKKGLKPKEIRDLIIKNYTINKDRADEKRINVLEKFRNYISEVATDRIKLNQDMKPGVNKSTLIKKEQDKIKKLKTEKPEDESLDIPENNKKGTSTTYYHLLTGPFKKLKEKGWIEKKNKTYSITDKYKTLFLQIWHRDNISNSKFDNIFAIKDYVFYFPNKGLDVNNSYLSEDEFREISGICDEISKYLIKINKIFEEAGNRKAADVCIKVIENFSFDDALKEFFYICLITDFATKTHLHGYDFNRSEKNSKGKFILTGPGPNDYNIITSAAEQFIKKKYGLAERAFQQLLKDSDDYCNLHSFIGEIFRDFITSHSSYTIISEKPSLFRGNEKSLFSDKDIAKFKSCGNLSNLDKLAKNIKNEDNLSPFETEIEITKIEPLLSIKQKHANIVYTISEVLQKNLVKTTEKRKKRLIFKEKPSFFEDMKFLDKYNTLGDFFPRDMPLIDGYENALKNYNYDKDKVYNNLKKWADLFNS